MIEMIDNRPVEAYLKDIPFDRYISRDDLFSKWGVKDRKGRDIISQIRKSCPKYVIISSSSHKGYKRPSTYEEVEKNIAELDSRIKELSKSKRQLKKLLKNKDQMGLGLIV